MGGGASAALWMRRLDADRFERLAGTEDGAQPFWSLDGRQIGFFAQGKLKKMRLADRALETLCDVPATYARGGAWSPKGIILFGVNYKGLMRLPESGGEPVPVAGLDSSIQENSLRFPQFLADGNHFLYFSRTLDPRNHALYLDALDTVGKRPRRKVVAADGPSAVGHDPFSARDFLVFPKEGRLWAQRFEIGSGRLLGEKTAISDDVGQFGVPLTGTLVFRRAGAEQNTLRWFDRSGRALESVGKPGDYWDVELSPDDSYAAAINHRSSDGRFWLETIDLARNVQSPFSDAPLRSFAPVWSRDSKQLYFNSLVNGGSTILAKPVDATGSARPLVNSANRYDLRDLSPDAKIFLADHEIEPDHFAIATATAGEFRWQPLEQTSASMMKGQFSPDGRSVAYQSNESGAIEIYVVDFPAVQRKQRISTAGGIEPRWRHDGKELFYLAPGGVLMSIATAGPTGFYGARPAPLFKFLGRSQDAGFQYAVYHDGRKFLVVNGAVETNARDLSVVFNWPQQLRGEGGQ